MKKLVIENGGMPLVAEDLLTIQNVGSESVAHVTKGLLGDVVILHGIELSDSKVTAGAMLINGEVLLFGGYDRTDDSEVYLKVTESVEQKEYLSGVSHPAYLDRYLSVSSAVTDMAVSELKRVPKLRSCDFQLDDSVSEEYTQLDCVQIGDVVKVAGTVFLFNPVNQVLIRGLPASTNKIYFKAFLVIITGDAYECRLVLSDGKISIDSLEGVGYPANTIVYIQLDLSYKKQ